MRRRWRWPALALYAVVVPLGMVLRLTTDPLRMRRRPATSNWQPAPERPTSINRARELT